MSLKFKEIEHKYIVGQTFDRAAFIQAVTALSPTRTASLIVKDRYFALQKDPASVYRLRMDHELRQLTRKSIEATNLIRTEINLDLSMTMKDVEETVLAFLQPFQVAWSGALTKDLWVAYFDDCEIVHYMASTPQASVSCVEFEAKNRQTLDDAVSTLEGFERKLGFLNHPKETKSLVEILFAKEMPTSFLQNFLRQAPSS